MTSPFKLSILVGDAPDRPPEKIAPGFDLAEIPNSIHVLPLESEARWNEHEQAIRAWGVPPIAISSHRFGSGLVASGSRVDNELIDFWIDRSLRRLAALGVRVVGCYGAHFPVPEGFSRIKSTDQALAYADRLADHAARYGVRIALEPMADLNTVFPRYVDGLDFVRRLGRPEVRVMADLAYFIKLDQPLQDIAREPGWCLHVHIAGVKGQPGVGDRRDVHGQLFRVLKDIGYEGAVSCACPWVSTSKGPMDFAIETAKTLKYMQDVRSSVFS